MLINYIQLYQYSARLFIFHVDKALARYIFRSSLTEAIKCFINHLSEIEHRQI